MWCNGAVEPFSRRAYLTARLIQECTFSTGSSPAAFKAS
jgi:hypothetical protein